MVDQTSPFSFNIRQAFLDYIIKNQDSSSTNSDEDIESINKNEIENEPPQIIEKNWVSFDNFHDVLRWSKYELNCVNIRIRIFSLFFSIIICHLTYL